MILCMFRMFWNAVLICKGSALRLIGDSCFRYFRRFAFLVFCPFGSSDTVRRVPTIRSLTDWT